MPTPISLAHLSPVVSVSLRPRQPAPGRKASNRKVRTWTVRAEGCNQTGWSQASAKQAMANFRKLARWEIANPR